MQDSGRLKFISLPQEDILGQSELGFDVFFANGHTDKQMLPMINYNGKTIVFYGRLNTNRWSFANTFCYGL